MSLVGTMQANPSPFAQISKTAWLRYAAAPLAVLIALLVYRALSPFISTNIVYITLFAAVAFSALYCGVGPSLLSVVLATLAVKYWFFPPLHSLRVLDASQWTSMAAFLVASGIVITIGEARRRENEKLRRAQAELEERIRERTLELDKANRDLRQLTARLLQLQDDERRRFARELHDSVGQMLAALAMNLAAARDDIARLVKTADTLTDSESLVQEMSKEVRTISYLLHPPLLDEAGLPPALRWYVQGFAERSKIEVDLQIPEDFGRLPREVETAVFRVVQECLTNIHRHSGSPVAKIRITRSHGGLRVEIEDKGKGIPREKQSEMITASAPGVGIGGMRERLRQLGGKLEIDSDRDGTVIMAWVPGASASATATASKVA
jgi:signal transduction histidine kinase